MCKGLQFLIALILNLILDIIFGQIVKLCIFKSFNNIHLSVMFDNDYDCNVFIHNLQFYRF